MSSLARMRPTGVTPSPRLVGVVRATIFNDPNVKHGTDARAKRASIGTTACVSGFGVAFSAQHRGARKAGSIPARWPSFGETGARFDSACLCADEKISGANFGETKARVVPAIRGTFLNGRNAEVDRIEERVAAGDGFHASDALICAATHAITTRRIKPEIDAGPSALSIARSNPTSRWGLKRLLRATYFNAATQTIGVNRAPSLEMVIGVAAPVTTSRSYAGHRFADTGHERALFPPASRAPGFCPADAGGSFFAMRDLMAGAR